MTPRSQRKWKPKRGWVHHTLSFFSAEWMLNWWWKRHGNGGGIILLRALWVTGWTYGTALGFHRWVACRPECTFILAGLWSGIDEKLPWFAAIFAGVYATFYSRFASQWTYLAGVYNQIKACEASGQSTNATALAQWKAGFIEDADDLHLAGKGMFASTILSWLAKPEVRHQFDIHTVGGAERRSDLERELKTDALSAVARRDAAPEASAFLASLTPEEWTRLQQELATLAKKAGSG